MGDTDFKPIQKEQRLFPFDVNYGKVSIGLDTNFVTVTIGKWPLIHLKPKPTFFYIRTIHTCQFIESSRVLMDSLFYVSFHPCLFLSVLQPRRVTLLSNTRGLFLQAIQQH